MEKLVRQQRKVGFGVRKKQIMKLLDGVWMMPRQVGRAVGISEGATRTLLRRYQVAGLLSKREGSSARGRKPYYYTLSRTGRKVLPTIKEKPKQKL